MLRIVGKVKTIIIEVCSFYYNMSSTLPAVSSAKFSLETRSIGGVILRLIRFFIVFRRTLTLLAWHSR